MALGMCVVCDSIARGDMHILRIRSECTHRAYTQDGQRITRATLVTDTLLTAHGGGTIYSLFLLCRVVWLNKIQE